MSRRESLTPDAERELEALDRALAGEPVGDGDLADIALLVEDVRALAPPIPPTLAVRVEDGLEAGFPRAGGDRRWRAARPRFPRPRVLVPALGTLAAALIALVVVLGGGSGQPADDAVSGVVTDGGAAAGSAGDESPTHAEALTERAAPGAGTKARRAAPEAIVRSLAPGAAPLTAGRVAPSTAPRKVQRSAQLTLDARSGRFQSTADAVVRTTDRFNGIVASSDISTGSGSRGEATFDLRIPTPRLDGALAAYSRLGHVSGRSQQLEDITGSFTSAQDRLTDARAERRGLLRALGAASTDRRISSLRARLRSTSSRIARLKGDLAALRRRADLSSLSLTVRAVRDSDGASGPGAGGGGRWGVGDAARDAGRALELVAGVALVALAVAVPLLLLGIPALLAGRTARRRRREAALVDS